MASNKELEKELKETKSALETTEAAFNELSEEIKDLKAQIKKSAAQAENKKSKARGGIDKIVTIDKGNYKIKFPIVRDVNGTVDFRDLNDKEIIALQERFPSNFKEV